MYYRSTPPEILYAQGECDPCDCDCARRCFFHACLFYGEIDTAGDACYGF